MQEHAEGPRTNTLKLCAHCGATIPRQARTCPKCEAGQPAPPPKPGFGG
jgi:ribosomal protein L40E